MSFQRLSGRYSGRLSYYITRWRQEVRSWSSDELEKSVVRKARRRGPRDPRLSWGPDELETRCGRESQQKAELPGLRLSSTGEQERRNADGHKSRGQYIAVFVQSPTPSHTQTLQ